MIRFVVSAVLGAGVNVAVHVIPPSTVVGLLSVPFATVKSATLKPVTACEKVMVTVVVSLAVNIVSVTTIVAVGRTVSIA